MKKTVMTLILLLAAVALTIAPSPLGAARVFAEEKLLPPPYVVADTHHMLVAVVWDAAAVRKMLPPGVKPVKEMTGGINIYQANRGYFIAPYQAAYFWVDIEGLDSATGAKGRWMLQAVYGPEEKTARALREFYGAPTRIGGSRIEETPDGTMRAVGILNGENFVTVEIQPMRNSWQSISFNLKYLGRVGKSKKLTVLEANGIGEFCPAEPISVKVAAPTGDPFAALQPKKVLWAGELINGAMALGKPLPAR
jgi:hypothetical protein